MELKTIKIENALKIVTYLIAFIAYVPLSWEITPFYSIIFLILFGFTISLEIKRTFSIPRPVLTFASFVFILLSVLRINRDEVVIPILDALVILLIIKFLEDKKFRDYMQIYGISLFLLAGYALMSIDLIFIGYFLGLLFLFTIATILLTYFSQDPHLEIEIRIIKKMILKSLLIPLFSIPLAAIIFLIIPRTTNPFFNFLNVGSKARSGFSDNVTLGKISDIQDDESVILRVNMERIPEQHLYWRGIVLDYFDGQQWTSRVSERPFSFRLRRAVVGERMHQTIFLEPYGNKYLFALDKPLRIYVWGVRMSEGGTFAFSRPIYRRVKYDAFSIISDAIRIKISNKESYLQLPEKISPRVQNLALEITQDITDTTEIVQALMNYFAQSKFKYSLEDLPISDDPIDAFLFDYQYGNCEYYASSLAVLLRLNGIPARLVGGYIGGEYNSTGGYYIVPQKNAHTWVEAHIEDVGWKRLDPTPPSNRSLFADDYLYELKLFFDSINYYWNSFVVNYDFQKQFELFQNTRRVLKKPKLEIPVNKNRIVKIILVILGIAFLAYTIYFQIRYRKTPEERIIQKFLSTLNQYGYQKHQAQGLEEFVATISQDQLRQQAFQFVKIFESYYYKDVPLSNSEIETLQTLIKKMKRKT